MDDLDGEELSELSCNSKKKQQNRILDSTSIQLTEQFETGRCKMGNSITEREGDKNISTGDATSFVASNNVAGGSNIDDDSDGKEKTDATPENLKKIDDVIIVDYVNDVNISKPGEELKIIEDESPSKQQPLAFTIDFGVGESSVTVAAATKYKNMVERFQSRHKRGASLSKLDDPNTTTTTVGRTSRISSAQSSKQSRGNNTTQTEASKVKLRIRERSTSNIRDANKRHSWSPRSSTHEQLDSQKVISEKSIKLEKINTVMQVKPCRPIVETNVTSFNSKNVMPAQMQSSKMKKTEQSSNDDTDRSSGFTPRSTAMQIALNKIEYACPDPLLDDFVQIKNQDDDCVSETGTYTVDGDNYTEEQKEHMNIDRSNLSKTQVIKDTCQLRPTNLPLLSSTSENRRHNNILEISYCHDSTNLKPKISYLEKIKSRVKNITKSPDKKIISPTDLGTFTSVTTSGVLSKKSALDKNPKLYRKNSLTKSQIDSSEYISTDSSLKSSLGQTFPTTFTDHQKAEYKLSVFTNQTDSQTLADSPENYGLDATITPYESPIENYIKPLIVHDTGLKTAQTKSDWIQEWAKNARARSSSTSVKPNGQMSRSYDLETTSDSVFVDPIVYHNKPIDRFRNHTVGDYEYSSDTNVSGRKICNSNQNLSGEYNGINPITTRPPLSPSRIPSPMHTIGRGRNTIRTRSSLQDLSPSAMCTPDTDIYLQKTAVAISNLAQSFSRNNSLHSKSPTTNSNQNSPRRQQQQEQQQQQQQQHYSADEYSPTQENNNSYHGLHKRNLSLDYRNNIMSNSLNNETFNGIMDYRNRNRPRQNSFDAALNSPRRFYQQQKVDYIEQTLSSIKQQQQSSPLRRSSSFSVKALSIKQPQQYNRNIQKYNQITKIITPPSKVPIQKSASSTSFRKMYSDYDDNIEYYINDEDDLVDDYCSSDDYDEPIEYYHPEPESDLAAKPLTNTRYNKALLMRIERSKQRVAGNLSSSSGGQNKVPISGSVIGCPNTPEMPRRSAQNVRSSMRQSVPRDSSLNRLRGEIPNSLASAKKQLLQTASINTRKVQPKYLDISKYKPAHGAHFLRKDDTKSTLVSRPEIKRSPSSASVTMNRGDTTRVSSRSAKSAGGRTINAVMNGSVSIKRDISVSKPKEAELAMWRRRATYDPMKAAAEGRKKQEDAKKLADQSQSKFNDNSVVMRSQSFHSGVGIIGGQQQGGNPLSTNNYRWTLTSTESSDEDEHVIATTNS